MANPLAEVRAQFRNATRNDVDRAILVAWKAALDSVKHRRVPELDSIGCGDNSCVIVLPRGMATNGGCRCERSALRLAVLAYRSELDRLTALLAEKEANG